MAAVLAQLFSAGWTTSEAHLTVLYLALLVAAGTGELHVDASLLGGAGGVVAAYVLGRTAIKAIIAWKGGAIDLGDAPKAVGLLLLVGLGCGLLPGCVTRVTAAHAQDGTVTLSYFSTKHQDWAVDYDPTTGRFSGRVQADTPSGWSASDVGGLAKDLGTAIGAGAGKAAKAGVGLP